MSLTPQDREEIALLFREELRAWSGGAGPSPSASGSLPRVSAAHSAGPDALGEVTVRKTLTTRMAMALAEKKSDSTWQRFCQDYEVVSFQRGLYARAAVERGRERELAGRISSKGRKRRDRARARAKGQRSQGTEAQRGISSTNGHEGQKLGSGVAA